jgi:hypothetical protein
MIVLLMGVTGSGKLRLELYALPNILGHKNLKMTQRYAELSRSTWIRSEIEWTLFGHRRRFPLPKPRAKHQLTTCNKED